MLSDILAGKRMERARRLLGKSLVYRLRGHAEVATSHFSGPRVNIASACRLFTVHVAAQVEPIPVFFHCGVFRTVLEHPSFIVLEICTLRFICYFCHRSVCFFFFSKEAAFENERKIALYACLTHR